MVKKQVRGQRRSCRRRDVAAAGGGVKWRVIDRALARYTAPSLLSLFSAAIDSPGCGAWEPQLVLLWARTLRHPPRGTSEAGRSDLAVLVASAERAAPQRGVHVRPRRTSPRDTVRCEVAGRRLRVHPGDYLHPLVFLRGVLATAMAIDPVLVESRGFTLTDVVELVLAHADAMTTALEATWPASQSSAGELGPMASPVVSDAEIAVARERLVVDAASLVASCSHPARAAVALAWLTCKASGLRVAAVPTEPVLGATLVVEGAAHRVAVPAALTLGTIAAATVLLAEEAAQVPLAHHRLQAITQWRAVRLLTGRTSGPVTIEMVDHAAEQEARHATSATEPTPVPAVNSPGQPPSDRENHAHGIPEPLIMSGSRHVSVAVSALGSGALSRALNWADDRLTAEIKTSDDQAVDDNDDRAANTDEQPVKVVLYGGPAILAYHEVSDTVRLHVEELAEILTDARGNLAVLACFLDELCRHPGAGGVLVFDLLDAWSSWREDGVLVPPGVSEETALAVIGEHSEDLSWDRAVRWERINQVLSDAEAPLSLDWPIARLSDDGEQASLFAPSESTALLVRTQPPVLIYVIFDDADLVGVSREVLHGVADGLLITAGRHPDIRSHLRLGHQAPLTLLLRFTAERTPEEHDAVQVGIGTGPHRGVAELTLGPDALELFQGEGREGHNLLGLAVYQALARLRADRGDHPGCTVEAFRSAWNSCPPVTILSVAESSTPLMTQVDLLPRGTPIQARALRSIAAALRQRAVPTKVFHGADARRVCREHLLPAVEQCLRERITACQPGLVEETLRCLGAAHATRHDHHTRIAFSLAGPFADNWTDYALQADEGTRTTRPLEILLEFILADRPRGTRQVDSLEVAELAALAELLLIIAVRTRAADGELDEFTIEITKAGVFTIDDTASAGEDVDRSGFDQRAYTRTCRERWVTFMRGAGRAGPVQPTRLPVEGGARSMLPFTRLSQVADPRLVQVDDLLRAAHGTGFDGVFAVLHVARDWPVGEHGFARIPRADLAAEARAWSELSSAEIDSAIDTLLLTGQHLSSLSSLDLAEVESRAHRLGLRPLPVIDDQVLIAPWLVNAAINIYASYVEDSRLPYPSRVLPPEIWNTMERHRYKRNKALEEDVRAVVDELGVPHRFRFTESEAEAAGIPDLPGEIDLLIAESEHNRLWVCEVKDPHIAISPRALAKHIERFIKNNGYVDKLLKKAGIISGYTTEAASACGLTTTRPWRVIPIIVTRRIEPAAFIANPRVAFTITNDLAPLIRAVTDPIPGPTLGAIPGGNLNEQ